MEEAQLATWPSGLRHFAQDGSRSTVCCFFPCRRFVVSSLCQWLSADDKCRHRRQTARYCPCADVKSPAIVVTEPSCDSLTAAAGRKRPKSCARCGLTPRIRPPPARDRCRESNRPYPPDPRPDGRSRGGTQAGTGTGARHPHRGTRSAIGHGRARRQT